jgi:hypothetical protein
MIARDVNALKTNPVAAPPVTGQDAPPLATITPQMAQRLDTTHSGDRAEDGSRRLRFELIFASVWLAVGFFLVPAVVFWIGIVLLGPYGEGQGAGLGTFYGDFFGDLANGEVRVWALALGPLTLIYLVRALYLGTRPVPQQEEPSAVAPTAIAKGQDQRRVEPRISE